MGETGRNWFKSLISTKNLRGLFATLAAAVLFLGFSASAVRAETYDWMFQQDEIAEISLNLSPQSRTALNHNPRGYVPATFGITGSEGQSWGPVSAEVKLKGTTSFRTLDGKAAFKLKFPKNSRPWGLKKMTLNNQVQDQSKVHEAMSYEIFRAMNVPAARTGYAEVKVNGDQYGLYLNVETLDDQFLEGFFDSTGHLYEGSHPSDFRQDLISLFEVDEGDEEEISDLETLVAAVDSPGSDWEGDITPLLDLDEMVRMWATEVYLGQMDGYVMHGNNFYLHSDEDGVFSMLPSGLDQSLVYPFEFYADDPLNDPLERERSALFTRCLAAETCRTAYTLALQEVRDQVEILDVADRSAVLFQKLRPHLTADPRKEWPVEAGDYWILQIQPFLEGQAEKLEQTLAEKPLAPTGLAATPAPEAIDITWDRGETRGAEPVTAYRLEYQEPGDPAVSTIRVEGAGNTSRRIAGLRAGAEYEVRIRAISYSGLGPAAELESPVKAGTANEDPGPDPDTPVDRTRPHLKSVTWLSANSRVHRLHVRVKLEKPALRLQVATTRSRPGVRRKNLRPLRLVNRKISVKSKKRPRWARVADAAGNHSVWKKVK